MPVTHAKTVTIPDPTQDDLDAQIALGNYPPGTLLADIALTADWNAGHAVDVDIAEINATGTPSALTFLRGDGAWAAPSVSGVAWGAISGTLSAQTDLQNALNLKVNSSALATVATTGAFADLVGKPTTLAGYGITDSVTAAVVAATYVPYTGATGAVNLGANALTVGDVFLNGNRGLFSPSLYALVGGAVSVNAVPKIWTSTNDTGASGNLINSITMTNESAVNKFGELAFALWPGQSGTPVDTFTFAVDPDRNNTENFRLRHRGINIFEVLADDSEFKHFTNVVLDGDNAKGLQSTNAAGTATMNIMRVAGGDYLQFGTVSANLTGMQFYPGAGDLAVQIDGTTANTWVVNRLGVGSGAGTSPTAKLTVYGAGGEGNNGQTIRLGANSTADYSIRREISTGTLEFEGSQVGARGFKFLNGSLAVGPSDAAASALMDLQSTAQGFLAPRMTNTQKNAITSPATGLFVYDTTNSRFEYYNGSAWTAIGGGGGGSSAFSAITGGTNTSAAMVVGTGASLAASGSGTIAATSCTGNAATATTLQTARDINGVSFNGSAAITVTAAAGTLTGATLAAGVTGSSLTSVGTLTGLTMGGTLNMGANSLTSTGTVTSGVNTITATNAFALAVGRTGATNPALTVNTATASSVTGLQITSAVTAGGVALVATDSGANTAMTINAKGTGTIGIGTVSTGAITLTRATTLSAGGTVTTGGFTVSAGNVTVSAGNLVQTSAASSTAAGARRLYTGAADTALTLSTEAPNVYFNMGQTRQHATGALTLQRDFRITGSAHSFVGASTLTDHAIVGIDRSTAAVTNATITNTHGLRIEAAVLPAGYTNSYGLTVAATTGATNNYALRVDGPISLGAASPGTAGQALLSGGPSGTPTWGTAAAGAGGSTTQIQYNNAGVLAGSANFVWDNANNALQAGGSTYTGAAVVGNQTSQGRYGIALTGAAATTGGGSNAGAGVTFALGWNDTGNRQLWLFDTAQIGGSGNSGFRYILGFSMPLIDGISGDGASQRAINIGSNSSIGCGWGVTDSNSNVTGQLHVTSKWSTGQKVIIAQQPSGGSGNLFTAMDSSNTDKWWVRSDGRMAYDAAGSAPSNTTTPVTWADFRIGSTLYKFPLYQ